MKTIYTNVSASLPLQLVKYIDEKAKDELSSKSDIIRRAILKMKEDDLWEELQRARQEVKVGKVFTGDLREIMKQFKERDEN